MVLILTVIKGLLINIRRLALQGFGKIEFVEETIPISL